MRIFDVGNKSNLGFWCAAPDAETAKQIALAAKHAKKIENLRATDVTENFLRDEATGNHVGISEIIAGDKTGRVMGEGCSLTFKEIMEGKKPSPTRWRVYE